MAMLWKISFASLWTLFCIPISIFAEDFNYERLQEEQNKPPIMCYQCNSLVDPDCPNIQPNQTSSPHYKPCDGDVYTVYHGHRPFCRKIVQTIMDRDGLVRVIRKCGWERHPRLPCYKMDNDDHLETVCQCFTDGCNTASTSSPLAVLLLLSSYLTLR